MICRNLVSEGKSSRALWLALVLSALVAACASPRDSLGDNTNSTRSQGGAGGSGAGGNSASGKDAGAGGSPAGSSMDAPEPGTTAPPATEEGCPTGQHKCAGTCVDSLSTATCGLACDPCPGISGGLATCDGNKCGVSCPPGKKPCLEMCVDLNAACDNTCPDGKNPCNGVCVEATNVNTCGKSCTQCKPPEHGRPTCDGMTCGFECEAGYRKCGETCVGPEMPCNGACPADFLLCAGKCVPGGAGSCCTDSECGVCKTCQNFRCQNSPNGQSGPMCSGSSCSGETLKKRVCQGGACTDNNTSCNNYGCQDSDSCRTSCRGGTVRQGNDCVACGGNNQVCCGGGDCNSGSCSNGRCCPNGLVGNGNGCGCPSGQKNCGGNRCIDNDACCSSCSGNKTCSNGSCTCKRMTHGDPCCDGKCIPQDRSPTGPDRLECYRGTCLNITSICGNPGKACCKDAEFCNDGTPCGGTCPG